MPKYTLDYMIKNQGRSMTIPQGRNLVLPTTQFDDVIEPFLEHASNELESLKEIISSPEFVENFLIEYPRFTAAFYRVHAQIRAWEHILNLYWIENGIEVKRFYQAVRDAIHIEHAIKRLDTGFTVSVYHNNINLFVKAFEQELGDLFDYFKGKDK